MIPNLYRHTTIEGLPRASWETMKVPMKISPQRKGLIQIVMKTDQTDRSWYSLWINLAGCGVGRVGGKKIIQRFQSSSDQMSSSIIRLPVRMPFILTCKFHIGRTISFIMPSGTSIMCVCCSSSITLISLLVSSIASA